MIIDALTCLIVGGLYIAVAAAVADAIFIGYLMIIPLFAGLLWLLSGVLTLHFVLSGKHARYEELWNANTASAETEAVAVVAIVELEEGRARPMSPACTTDDLPTGTEENKEGAADAALDASEPTAAQKPT